MCGYMYLPLEDRMDQEDRGVCLACSFSYVSVLGILVELSC